MADAGKDVFPAGDGPALGRKRKLLLDHHAMLVYVEGG
jgi:hypothetical protein